MPGACAPPRHTSNEAVSSSDDAASLSGVSVDLLSRLENGKGSVRLDKLLAVLDSLGLALLLGPKDHPTMQSVSRAGAARPEQP